MKRRLILLVTLLAALAAPAFAQEMPAPPSTEHVQKLSWLVGTFDGKEKLYMMGEPMDGTSHSVNEFVLQGRYLQSRVTYDMAGEKMDGIFMVTYNDSISKYEAVWFDSMSGQTMRCHGTLEGQTLSFTSEELEMPGMGKQIFLITYTRKSDGTIEMKLDMKAGDEVTPLIRSTMKKV